MNNEKKKENPYHCGECIKLVWNTEFVNLDCQGRPIHGRCLVSGLNRIRTEQACDAFTMQTDDSLNFYKICNGN